MIAEDGGAVICCTRTHRDYSHATCELKTTLHEVTLHILHRVYLCLSVCLFLSDSSGWPISETPALSKRHWVITEYCLKT